MVNQSQDEVLDAEKIDVKCVYCRRPIVKTLDGFSGIRWVHEDGIRMCVVTYALPNWIEHARRVQEQQAQ